MSPGAKGAGDAGGSLETLARKARSFWGFFFLFSAPLVSPGAKGAGDARGSLETLARKARSLWVLSFFSFLFFLLISLHAFGCAVARTQTSFFFSAPLVFLPGDSGVTHTESLGASHYSPSVQVHSHTSCANQGLCTFFAESLGCSIISLEVWD